MKERIARAKQALPNGYCGLPLVQTCPHPNACLTCESFLTDGSFRAVHEQQQAETRRLLAKARTQGNVRLIEMLERDEHSLTRILDGLDQIDQTAMHAAHVVDLRDLADREQRGRVSRRARPRSLAEAAAKRTLDAEQRVRGDAAGQLDADGATVSFAKVAKHARVSRAFLYAHTELRSEIEALRSLQRPRRRGCPSASARATPRSVPGCGPRWMRTSASAWRSPRCARSSRSRTAACASWSSTAASGEDVGELAGARARRRAARRRRRIRHTDRPAHRERSDGAADPVPGQLRRRRRAQCPLPGRSLPPPPQRVRDPDRPEREGTQRLGVGSRRSARSTRSTAPSPSSASPPGWRAARG